MPQLSEHREHDAAAQDAARAEPRVAGGVEAMAFHPDRRFWVVYLCLMMVQFLSAM